mmetsp:Transcript_29654/g.63800  ORF Transcript_29654/g.63800 Transcript_29654/m.63800 type:complete len:245 (+) Transcript_29654:277-1011(+)
MPCLIISWLFPTCMFMNTCWIATLSAFSSSTLWNSDADTPRSCRNDDCTFVTSSIWPMWKTSMCACVLGLPFSSINLAQNLSVACSTALSSSAISCTTSSTLISTVAPPCAPASSFSSSSSPPNVLCSALIFLYISISSSSPSSTYVVHASSRSSSSTLLSSSSLSWISFKMALKFGRMKSFISVLSSISPPCCSIFCRESCAFFMSRGASSCSFPRIFLIILCVSSSSIAAARPEESTVLKKL